MPVIHSDISPAVSPCGFQELKIILIVVMVTTTMTGPHMSVLIPEFWADKVAYREIAFPGVLRVALAANEHGRCIVKAKILMPVPVILVEQPLTLAFLRCRAAALAGASGSGAVLM